MKKSGSRRTALWVLVLVAGGAAAWGLVPELREAATWQRMASPGALSRAHASLENNCAACHTSVEGAVPSKCMLCHASDTALLQRQPTAFHSSVSSCRECHLEHRGASARPTKMDHAALAAIGIGELESHGGREELQLASYLRSWSGDAGGDWPAHTTPEQAALDCNACHSTADPHVGLFGKGCVECHGTESWSVAEFQHPSSRSRDCAHCHQAPPSHYMMHFKMISAKVARKPHARVEQCFECHRTTSWNDIPGIGRYKHH